MLKYPTNEELAAMPRGIWFPVLGDHGNVYQNINGQHTSVSLDYQPTNNLRGEWRAALMINDYSNIEWLQNIERCFPRHYFDEATAKAEIYTLLERWGEFKDDDD